MVRTVRLGMDDRFTLRAELYVARTLKICPSGGCESDITFRGLKMPP